MTATSTSYIMAYKSDENLYEMEDYRRVDKERRMSSTPPAATTSTKTSQNVAEKCGKTPLIIVVAIVQLLFLILLLVLLALTVNNSFRNASTSSPTLNTNGIEHVIEEIARLSESLQNITWYLQNQDNIIQNATCSCISDVIELIEANQMELSYLHNNMTELVWDFYNWQVMQSKNIVDILSNLHNVTVTTAADVTDIQQFGPDIVSLLEAMENITDVVMYLRYVAHQQTQNNISQIFQLSETLLQKLANIGGTLSSLESAHTSTSGVIVNILLLVERLIDIHNTSETLQPISCENIKTILPDGASGYYNINGSNIYCNMEELCGTGGGWTRLAFLNMSDPTENCPTGFELYTSEGIRACGRQGSDASCSSVTYSSNGISYSQICGRVVGYQYGSPDAVDTRDTGYTDDINSYYVDGVSITRGSPRQHVWTLMAGVRESSEDPGNCPCNCPSGMQEVLPFIGSHYYCESGNPNNGHSGILYTSDQLWDGQDCGSQETACCSSPDLPWFHRDYNVTTTDYIELRVCGDQVRSSEDVPVSFYEIYVK